MNIKFDIRKQSDNYIIIRVDGEYSQHAHLKTLEACKTVIHFINRNKLPKNKYFQTSCKRLLTEEEYERLRPLKQMYYNVNRGVS